MVKSAIEFGCFHENSVYFNDILLGYFLECLGHFPEFDDVDSKRKIRFLELRDEIKIDDCRKLLPLDGKVIVAETGRVSPCPGTKNKDSILAGIQMAPHDLTNKLDVLVHVTILSIRAERRNLFVLRPTGSRTGATLGVPSWAGSPSYKNLGY